MWKRLLGAWILCLAGTTGCGGPGEGAEAPAPPPPTGGEELDVPPLPVESTDPLVQSPSLYKVLHENDWVRVLELRFPTGTRDEYHQHPASALYMVTAANLRIRRLDGVVRQVEQEAGTAFVQGPTDELQAVENQHSSEFHGIQFEIKKASESEAVESDPVTVSSNYYRVLAEDHHCRVLEMKLGPGEKDEMHGHPRLVVYAVDLGRIRVHPPEGQGEAEDLVVQSGQVLFEEPVAAHQVENLGDGEIRFVLVELK